MNRVKFIIGVLVFGYFAVMNFIYFTGSASDFSGIDQKIATAIDQIVNGIRATAKAEVQVAANKTAPSQTTAHENEAPSDSRQDASPMENLVDLAVPAGAAPGSDGTHENHALEFDDVSLDFGEVHEELLANPWNQCGLILTQMESEEALKYKRDWDGSFKPNTKVGEQWRVYFTDVDQKLTQSIETDDQFLVNFYSDARLEGYGRQETVDLLRDSENGPIGYKFTGDQPRNAISPALRPWANGATFSLAFRKGDKDLAVRLIKQIFAKCPFNFSGPKCADSFSANDPGTEQCHYTMKEDGDLQIQSSWHPKEIVPKSNPNITDQERTAIAEALIMKMKVCFDIPAGARGHNIPVAIHFMLNLDGSVKGRPEPVRNSSNPIFQAVARAAISAILECQNYNLPAEYYDQWKDNVIEFSGMTAQ